MVTKEEVMNVLKECHDPEIPINIVDLGLVYNVKVEDRYVYVLMTLTSPFCPIIDIFVEDMKEKIRSKTNADKVEIDITFDPPWDPSKMSESAKRELGLY
ncbi:MAG: iron-sulfur cluster assembly protein [Conexivisphaerales archaeon]